VSTIRLIERFDDLLPFRARWNALAERSPSATIFQTFEWLEAWWRVFGGDRRLQVVLALDGDALVAAAPLMTHRVRAYGRARTCLTFAGGTQADYTDVLYADDASLRGLVHALRAHVAWDLLELGRIPSISATTRGLAEEFPGWRGASAVSDVSAAYVFDAQHDGGDVVEKKRMRQYVHAFHKAGTVEVRHLTAAADIAPELDDFFQQHVERRRVTDVPSNFVDDRARTFYGLLTEALAPRGKVLFSVLALDGKAAAYHYGFVHRGRLVYYKPSFAIHLGRLSPGQVLLGELFRYCRDQRLAELDLTIGDEAYKARFSNVSRHNVRFRAFRSPVVQAIDRAQRRVKEGAKRVNAVEALVRHLRSGG
jgi:CelD/BcsL family acetyltransferase involved in cellulose biosynthesis